MSTAGVRGAARHPARERRRRHAVAAALPPLLMGTGIAIISSAIRAAGGPHLVGGALDPSLPHGFAIGAAVVMLATACISSVLAGLDRLPLWSFSWVATDFVGLVVALNLVVEDRSFVVSPAADLVALLLLLLAGLTVLAAAVLRGWRHAGLLSLGFSAALALSLCFWAVAGPSRHDLGWLAAVAGLLLAALTYVFVVGSGPECIAVLWASGALCAGLSWMADSAFQSWEQFPGQPRLLWPLLGLTWAPLIVGPLLGLWMPRLRRARKR